MAQEEYAIQLKGITKTFGSVVANSNINLDLKKGEILALLGENGSGKTTLMNMLSGIYRPDKGQIFIDGKKVYIDSPEDSKRLGIGMIHQHYKLIEKFSVADNIWLGYHQPDEDGKSKENQERVNEQEGITAVCQENSQTVKDENNDLSAEANPSDKENDIIQDAREQKSGTAKENFKKFFVACGKYIKKVCKKVFLTKSRYTKIEEFAKSYGFDIDPKKRICDMAVSEKQTVEIVKVLFYGAKVLILDEPTAVLTEQEIQKLFSILKNMKEKGCSIIIITHKLNEVMAISDRVSILRKGEYIGTVNTSETNEAELTEMMVGKKVDLHIDRPVTHFDEDMLVLKNVCVNNSNNLRAIDNVSFKVRRGEILGVAGISGSGQKELCEAIAGLEKIKSGTIEFMGQTISGKSPLDIINLGIAMSFIPEDRLGMGLAGSLNITDNMMLKTYRGNKFNPFVDRKKAGAMAKGVVEKLDVQTPDTDKTPVRRLSGGNVQKVLLGREIETTPQVIVTAYPVRGLDINSSYLIYDILNRQKQDGVGILFVGEDLDVMLQLCDKILVLCHGKVTGIVEGAMATKERLGLMMTGMFASEAFKDIPEAVVEDGQLTEEERSEADKQFAEEEKKDEGQNTEAAKLSEQKENGVITEGVKSEAEQSDTSENEVATQETKVEAESAEAQEDKPTKEIKAKTATAKNGAKSTAAKKSASANGNKPKTKSSSSTSQSQKAKTINNTSGKSASVQKTSKTSSSAAKSVTAKTSAQTQKSTTAKTATAKKSEVKTQTGQKKAAAAKKTSLTKEADND